MPTDKAFLIQTVSQEALDRARAQEILAYLKRRRELQRKQERWALKFVLIGLVLIFGLMIAFGLVFDGR